MKKKILITIADGFHYRYLIDTSIVNGIAKDFDLNIVTIPSLEVELINYAKDNCLIYNVHLYEVKPNIFINILRSLYKKLLIKSSDKIAETINIKNENIKLKSKSIIDLILSLICISDKLTHLLLKFLKLSFFDKRVEAIFRNEKINFFISSTPGQKEFDLPFLFFATHNNIKSLSPVYSWDNLTAKGPFFFNPDYLIVWNDIMKQEGIYYHGYSQDTIFACGVPVFDPYYSIIRGEDESIEFKKSLGFKTSQPLITLTTIPEVYFGDSHIKLAELILNERNKSLPNFSLLIRPHPMDETDYTNLNGYLDVVVDYYGTKPDKSLVKWKPTNNNMIHLGKTMKYSSVVLNIASTITIDAACFDTPIINIGFDIKPNKIQYIGSISRYYEYTHYKHIVESKACFIAGSFQMLIEQLNLYLSDPTIHQTERREMINKQLMDFDGNSSKRIISKIIELIQS
jgi:hypothetical protein